MTAKTMITTSATTYCLMLSLYIGAQAQAAPVPLTQLVDAAGAIAVVEVRAVDGRKNGSRVATAQVLDVWKGRLPGVVRYLTSPGEGGDAPDARSGEVVVLFLKRGHVESNLVIARALQEWVVVSGARGPVVSISPAVALLVSLGGDLSERRRFVQKVDLRKMQEYVRRAAQANKALNRTRIQQIS